MQHNVTVIDKDYRGINPIQFGYHSCPSSHFVGPVIRTYWLIHFVVSGFGIYKINGTIYNIHPGEMFIIPPYIEIYYEADKATPWSYIWIGFTSDGALPVELPHTINCPEALSIFNAMKNCEEFSEGRSLYLNARLWDLFALLSKREDSHSNYIKQALDYIHSEYMNGITVEEIARKVNLERTYFSVLFKKKTGISPKQYLLHHRMSVAASLIVNNNASVSVAAFSTGYNEVSTFSHMFKRHFGVSPTDFKREREMK